MRVTALPGDDAPPTRPYVPDGDPCPAHPEQPSQLIFIPGLGLYSQCEVCCEDFLAWYGSQRPAPRPMPDAAAPEPARPTPVQADFGL